MPTYTRRVMRMSPVYEQPDTTSTEVGTLAAGRYVTVLDMQRGWLHIQDMANVAVTGYIPVQALTRLRRTGETARRTTTEESTPLESEASTTPSGPGEKEMAEELTKVDSNASTPEAPVNTTPEGAPLEPIKKITTASTYVEKQTARVWNNYGGLLSALAEKYGIEPIVAAAVMAVESGGTPFGPDGKTIIRFENHLFYRYWGKDNQELFFRYFQFDEDKQWRNHTFRRRLADDFDSFHGNQSKEWEAYSKASELASRPAVMSISMGMAQILGSNFKRLDYASPEAMLVAFNDQDNGERYQILGLFKFIESDYYNRGIPALRNEDYTAFAEMYNGAGQAATYGNLIAERVRLLQDLLASS